LNDTDNGAPAERQIEQFCRERWTRLVRYVKRKMSQRKAKKQDEAPVDKAARITASATRWIAIFTLVSVSVNVGMFFVLRRQLKEMHDSGVDTHTLAQAANTEAGKMSDVSTAADKIRQAAQDMVTQDQRIADNAQKSLKANDSQSKASLDASNRQSQNALDATINNARLDERPWVTLSRFQLSKEPEAGKDITIQCSFLNSGKTPALHVAPQGKLYIAEGFIPMTQFSPFEQPFSQTIVAPGANQIGFTTKPQQFQARDIERYTNKIAPLYLHARITYKDTFGREHWTTVCASKHYGETEFSYCADGNEMDQN
jgi:hypothetical protein